MDIETNKLLKLISENKYNEAQMLIKDTKDGLKLTHYYQLYK